MAKLNANYETVYILDPTLTEEATAALVEKFKTLVENNGTLAEVDEWASAIWPIPSTTTPRATMCS